MIHILTFLLITLFAVQYFTQSTRTHSRINTQRRIHNGLLSYKDIVALSHRLYTSAHLLIDMDYISGYTSGRIYKSTNGRLYIHQMINGHKSIRFISRQTAIRQIQHSYRRSLVSTKAGLVWFTPATAAI